MYVDLHNQNNEDLFVNFLPLSQNELAKKLIFLFLWSKQGSNFLALKHSIGEVKLLKLKQLQ